MTNNVIDPAAASVLYERLRNLAEQVGTLSALRSNEELWGAYSGAIAALAKYRPEAPNAH